MRSHSRSRRSFKAAATTTAAAAALALALSSCSSAGGEGDADAEGALNSVNVIAPADPGGGWDQTARTLSQTLTGEGLVGSAPVTNIGGAGGTVGLASLATETDPYTLMVTGAVMVGAVETNASDVRIEDTTPIAKLTEEALVIVVPADSEFQTAQDLVDAIVADGQAVTVTGGSAGGIDHILAGLLLTESGVESSEVPGLLNYIPNSGGGEAVTMLLGNNAMAGISGVAEFSEHVASGDLRALAVSSPERVDMLPDAPTLIESDIDIELTNWRGVIAPGDITDEERAALEDLVAQAQQSEAWQSALADNGWADAYLAGEEFEALLADDIATTQETLKSIGLLE
ncbi:Bug family tripartite tricarboxylate transporter substrate binding protein [Agrococcus casei]|uniref:Bug family tripartite tricarboxylate transporter substrate binding protein n=1 Tax=Agrococcus casei TaxID=343512 RepID=UPI003F8EDF91